MRPVIPACLVILAGVAATAQTTGRLQGKITNKEGKPVANATLVIKRQDITWSKTLTVDANGQFLQVGLDPKQFDLVCEAPGYTKWQQQIKVIMGDKTEVNITMLTPEQAAGTVPMSETEMAASQATTSFNKAVELFNGKQFSEALPLLEQSYTAIKDSLAKAKDDKAKDDVKTRYSKIEKVLALCYFELGNNAEAAEKTGFYDKSEPMLKSLSEASPKDTLYLECLGRIAEARGQADVAKKYQDQVEAIIGPNPDRIYNKAWEALSAGDLKGARASLERLQQVKPDYPEYYFAMATVEYSSGDLKATKALLKKYLEIAPNGRKAAEVKEMLADPSLKNIK